MSELPHEPDLDLPATPSGPAVVMRPVPTGPAEAHRPEGRPSLWRRLRSAPGVLVLGVVLLLAGGFVANTAQTAGGTIRITPVSFPGAGGQMLTGLLYVPSTATAKTPAPGVVAIEGYINSADTMDGFSIEMARRGAVVLAANQTGQGGSTAPAFATAFGGPPALAYLQSLPMVRHGDIGLIGHSMGGWASVLAAATNPTGYRSIALISSSVSTPVYEPVPGTPSFPRNVAVIEATNSEFSTLMWAVPKGTEIPRSPRLEKMFGTSSPVVPGRVYGSVANGTGRVLYLDGAIHPGLTFDPTAIKQAVSWMQQTLPGTTSLPASNQIWLWDEIGTFLGYVGVLLLLFGVGGTLLRTRFFSSVAKRLPENRALRGVGWWVSAAVLVLIGPITFFWFQTWGQKQFPAGSTFPESITTGIVVWAVGDALIGAALFVLWHFLGARRRPSPALSLVGAGTGTAALATGAAERDGGAGSPAGPPSPAGTPNLPVLGQPDPAPRLGLGYHRRALAAYGVAEGEGRVIDWPNVGKSFLLALCSVAAAYVAVFFFQWAWSSDVRLWVVNVKPMTTMYLPVFLSYVWPLFVYFLVVSVVLFGQLRTRVTTLGKFMTIVTALMTVGFVGLIGVEYGASWATGQLATATQPLLAIVAFQFIPVFIIAGTVLSYFFWKTGRIWTGVFISSLFITGMIVTNTALQARPW